MAQVQEDTLSTECQLDSLKHSSIASNTRDNYHRRIVEFLIWLYEVKPISFTPIFIRSCVTRGAISSDKVHAFIDKENERKPPLKFNYMTAKLIMTYMIHIRNTSEREGKVLGFGAGVGQSSNTGTEADERGEDDHISPQFEVHTWAGGLHLLPEQFELPKVRVKDMWHLWLFGENTKVLPPFKRLQPADFSTKNKRKRLSDLRYLMKRIEARADELGLCYKNPSIHEANEIFRRCSSAIEVEEETPRKRQRRNTQIGWLTVVSLLRKRDRQ